MTDIEAEISSNVRSPIAGAGGPSGGGANGVGAGSVRGRVVEPIF
jgi:hypothetical protein